MLLGTFAGKTLTMREVYVQHSVDTPYVSKNYKTVLREMEDKGLVQTHGRKSSRGFANDLRVTFPKRR